MKVPAWYRRYYSWTRSVGVKKTITISAIVGTFIGLLILPLSTVLFGKQAALYFTLDLLGWLMILGLPTAGFDAWAGGLLNGQKVLPWVRLTLLAGGGVVGGAYLLFNY